MLQKFCIQLKKKNKGFTLIELIVVIAILGILAAVLIPTFTGFQDKARSTQALVEAKQWATAADAYLIEHDTLAALATADITAITTIAGDDVDGAISATSISGGHVGFTYTIAGEFQVVRDASTGEFTVTIL